jgi:outer membrane autotransporter protein
MKTRPIKVTVQTFIELPDILAAFIHLCFVVLSLSVATSVPVLAVDAVWLSAPVSGDWNTGTNWSTSLAPIHPGDTATFNTSTLTSLTLSGGATVESITFNPGASAFTINTNGEDLHISGAGIVNNSGTIQAITNNALPSNFGTTTFLGTSTAGKVTIINNGGMTLGAFGVTAFAAASTAGSATITNNGAKFPMALGGVTAFLVRSNAGGATITNNGGTIAGAFGGVTIFGSTVIPNLPADLATKLMKLRSSLGSSDLDTPSAGNATIINNGGTLGGIGGTTAFLAHSDGGTARAITNGNGNFDISLLASAGMGIGSIEGSGNYFLGSKTLTVGGNNLSTTVSGVIQDGSFFSGIGTSTGAGSGGSLTKIGTGTLTLTGRNTYTGVTTVNGGSLIVDGSIESAQTTVNGGSLIVDGSIESAQTVVNAGGLLGGNGFVGPRSGGSLVNSGIVSPGDSPGTLTVNGNYTQNAGGTLRIQIAGLAPSEHDLLAVTGHASLAGTLQLISLSGFKLHVGDQVKFLTAHDVSGTFGTVQEFPTGTIVKAQVVYDPDAVVLEGTQGSFVEGACTPNAVAVAHALDSAVGDPQSARLISFLDDQPIDQLCGDLQLIAPEELASIFNAAFSLANVQTANLMRRMDDIRAGSTGFSSSGFTLNDSAPNFSTGFAGVTGPEGKSGPPVMAPIPENRWGVWITGIGNFTNVDSTNEAAGYDLQTGGVNLGIDYRVCPNFAIGLTAGYAHTNADLANGGSLDVNSGSLGFYATVFGNGFYLDAAVTGGPSGYSTQRAALLGSANGSTDGGNLNVLVAAGYDWKKGGLTIGPTASFQYTYVGFGGFTESGSLAPLDIHSQNAESERTAFGMKASYDWKVGHVVIVPQINLAWQHEYGDQAYSIVSSFANGAGNSFTVNSPKVGRDSLLIGAGAAVLLSERVSVYAYYDGELARTNYQSNSVSAGVRVTF